MKWADLPISFQSISLLMDGSRFNVKRPQNKEYQKRLYSGYTKTHNFILLGILAPNGIYLAVSPLVVGSTNDAAAVLEFDIPRYLSDELDATCVCDSLFKFEDRVVSLRDALCDLNIIDDEQMKQLRSIRTSMEHSFSAVKESFPYIHQGVLKLEATAPALIIKTAFLLHNIRTCMRGNNISHRFKLLPPTLSQYLNLQE